jgi:hypothetical protein
MNRSDLQRLPAPFDIPHSPFVTRTGMAEDLVVSDHLSRDMIEAGKRLIRILDAQGHGPSGALWYRLEKHETRAWMLGLAMREREEQGPRAAYGLIFDALRDMPDDEPQMSSMDVTAFKLSDPIIQGLAEVVTTEPGAIEGHWRPSAAVGSTMLGDAYVYRMAPGVREAGEAPPAQEEARV